MANLTVTFQFTDSNEVFTIPNVPDSVGVKELLDTIGKNYPGKTLKYVKANNALVYGDPDATPLPTTRKMGPAYIDPANPGDWVDTGSGSYYNKKTHELRLK